MSENSLRVPPAASVALTAHADYIENLYAAWQSAPESVTADWQAFFRGFDLARESDEASGPVPSRAQSQVASLIFAYRSVGHLIARTDPLAVPLSSHPALSLERFGLDESHLDQIFDTGHMGGPTRAPLRDIIAILKEIYCRSIGVEYTHIQNREVRRWLQAQMEPIRNQPTFDHEKKLETLRLLIDAELFEAFLQRRYPGQKRFSLEGAEAAIPAVHAVVEMAPDLGLADMVMGMTHRGRLNVLANILDKPYEIIFSEFEDIILPERAGGGGDVKYHRGFSSDHVNKNGLTLHVSLTANPSHLEAVCPVVEGRTRAKQRRHHDTDHRDKVLPFLIHGDAAFSGQGLVAETLNLSQLNGYRTGGTIHFIVNNQIGFTTDPTEARSTRYPTDVAKMVEAPIFHVNGDDPEAVVFVTELALRFRQEFGRDVVVDMVCYRRHGHNEGDEPAFTQPVMYDKIKNRPSVRTQYKRELVAAGIMPQVESDRLAEDFQQRLQAAFEAARKLKNGEACLVEDTVQAYGGVWAGLDNPYSNEPVETGVSHADLLEMSRVINTVPPGFHLNPKVARQLPKRLQAVQERAEVDWGHAELLAFGSLLVEGMPVRLSGQDSVRGTFSHRHAHWHDMETQEEYVPLNKLRPGQARFCGHNSMLSEAAVLGFDYGYSLEEPNMVVIWEAQFGDFANGAQVIIDQFVVASLAKWQRPSGLTMLLPHGYEGQGPEHSNAYLERYLAACAEKNIQVCNLSTPAQYFHALRRQVKRPFRRPLIIMSPKSLLRHKDAVSPVEDLVVGRFCEILDDPSPPAKARRVVLASGKVFWDLMAARAEHQVEDVALVRLEQLYPFEGEQLKDIVAGYPQAEQLVWCQEEPKNRGAYTFVLPRLMELFSPLPILYAGRAASASPATGSFALHRQQQAELVAQALKRMP